MTLALYMDHHVERDITVELRKRGVDVLTAYEDRTHETPDPDLLDQATRLGRVLFTRDQGFLSEAARRQEQGTVFSGIVYAHDLRVPLGTCIVDLELMAKGLEPSEMLNTLVHLPL